MTAAQGIVNKVDGKQLSSVEDSLRAVEAARTACEKAGRTSEQDQLLRAKNELSAHLAYLQRKAGEPPVKKLTPEEIAVLVKQGDPACPKGQAYRRSPAQEIKCTGPQLVDMSWRSAEAYFGGRGYKMTSTDSPPTLRAEYGAELVVYTFATPKDDKPPRCLTFYPPPGIGWQEATGRVTGVPLRKLESGKTVRTDRGELALRIDQSDTKLIVYVGECG